MKTPAILALCLSTTIGHAAISKGLCPYLLNIIIQNSTGSDCHLIQQTINQGNSHSSELPLTIAAMQKSPAYTFETNVKAPYPGIDEEINVTLTYECGLDKILSLNTSKTLTQRFLYNTSVVGGLPISLANSNASYTTEKSKCYTHPPIPDTIIWTLE